MIRKLCIIAAVTSVISTASFAMEIQNGKLLKHREWATSDRIKFTFKDGNKKELLPILSADKKTLGFPANNIDYAISETRIFEYSAVIGEPLNLSGYSILNLYNFTGSSQTYSIQTDICVIEETSSGTAIAECATSEDEMELSTDGWVTLEKIPTLQITMNNADSNYHSRIYTAVYRDGSPVYVGTHSAPIDLSNSTGQQK